MQKYRFDEAAEPDSLGQILLYTKWMGGPTLAGIRNAVTPWGRRTVYVTGEPDSAFSIPAVCSFRKKRLTGYLGRVDTGVKYEIGFHAHDDSLRVMPATMPEVVDLAQRLRVGLPADWNQHNEDV